MIPNAGTPRYIPRFSAITESPSPRTSDSEFAFSMIDKLDSIGVSPSFTTSLNIGFSLSMSAIAGKGIVYVVECSHECRAGFCL